MPDTLHEPLKVIAFTDAPIIITWINRKGIVTQEEEIEYQNGKAVRTPVQKV